MPDFQAGISRRQQRLAPRESCCRLDGTAANKRYPIETSRIVGALMKRLLLVLTLVMLCAGCATSADYPGLRATEAMTDMDGVPITSGAAASAVGFGFGIGSWGHHGGAGIGIGTAW